MVMEKNISLSAPLKRIKVLDALRGFALLGVILMHMIQHFGFFTLPSENGILEFPILDEIIQWIGSNIIMGRFINIFAFLFGLSFFIQMDRAAKKGIDFRLRFVWRMVLLLVLGLLTHSFFNLEIISVYGFFGLLMIVMYRVKNWLLLLLVAFLILGGPRVLKAIDHNSNLETEQVADNTGQEANNRRTPRELQEHIVSPSFINSAVYNYKERLTGKLNYQFGFIGRGYVTFGLFLLGLVMGRIRFFETLETHKKRNLLLFFGFLSATILVTWVQTLFPPQNIGIFFRPDGQHIGSQILIVQALGDLAMVLFTTSLTMGFVSLYQKIQFRKYLEVLSPYGRTALTNYIMQGVIGAFLFAPWAFGSTFGNWGVAALFFLGIVIYAVQIICSKYWLKKYLYGPLEWLWRSGTYLKLQPFRKK